MYIYIVYESNGGQIITKLLHASVPVHVQNIYCDFHYTYSHLPIPDTCSFSVIVDRAQQKEL